MTEAILVCFVFLALSHVVDSDFSFIQILILKKSKPFYIKKINSRPPTLSWLHTCEICVVFKSISWLCWPSCAWCVAWRWILRLWLGCYFGESSVDGAVWYASSFFLLFFLKLSRVCWWKDTNRTWQAWLWCARVLNLLEILSVAPCQCYTWLES